MHTIIEKGLLRFLGQIIKNPIVEEDKKTWLNSVPIKMNSYSSLGADFKNNQTTKQFNFYLDQ